jgi:small nuclear ribonucleoprotein (snRNP)-like protein
MGTKQLRLSDPAQINSRIRSFLGKKINIVLSDNTVMFGELREVNDSGILLLNMRFKKITYPLKNIAEIYLDTNV